MSFCSDCNRHFKTPRALNQHFQNSAVHETDWECNYCDATFYTRSCLELHIYTAGHYDKPDHYCSDCDREFISANNLKAHMNSRTHRGTKISCPWCPHDFVTASGLATHLESGACIEGINHRSIYETIRRRDTNGVLTMRLIEGPGGQRFNETVKATVASWNGLAYECPVCDRGFSSLVSLNQHLNSPVHRQPMYHCLKRACGKEFRSMAGLVGHFESEKCGAMSFDRMQQTIGGFVTGKLMIDY